MEGESAENVSSTVRHSWLDWQLAATDPHHSWERHDSGFRCARSGLQVNDIEELQVAMLKGWTGADVQLLEIETQSSSSRRSSHGYSRFDERRRGQRRSKDRSSRCCKIWCCVILLVSFCLFSVSSVEPTEQAVLYNVFTKQPHEQIYRGGLHFICPWNQFFRYPHNYQEMELVSTPVRDDTATHMQVRSRDGLPVHMVVTMQFQYIPEELLALYTQFQTHQLGALERAASDAIQEACGEFDSFHFFKIRKFITETIAFRVNNAFRGMHTKVIMLQMYDVDFPFAYDEAITNVQVQSQFALTEVFHQQHTLKMAEILLVNATTGAEIVQIGARAQAKATLARANATAHAGQALIKIHSDVYRQVQEVLHLTTRQLQMYVWLREAVSEQVSTNLLVSLFSNKSFATTHLNINDEDMYPEDDNI